MTVQELLNAADKGGLQTIRWPVFLGSLTFLLPLLVFYSTDISQLDNWNGTATGLALAFSALLGVMMINLILPLISSGPDNFISVSAGSLIMAYVAFPLTCSILLLYFVPLGWYWLIIALLAPWASDVTAYFTGSAIGRHHILPKISPKKTLEGCLGGIIGTVIVLMLYSEIVLLRVTQVRPDLAMHLLFAMVGGVVLSIASQLGDWLASVMKRCAGIKDFGKLLPGHGGVLDRFDSAFFTMPVTFLLAILYWQFFLK
jgi:phosphatidate cytidylyltransferase